MRISGASLTVDYMSVIALTPDVSSVTDPRGCVPTVQRTVAVRRTRSVLNQLVGAVSCVHQHHATSRLNATYRHIYIYH